MRRKDREMDRDFALKVIDSSNYGNLAMVDGDEPYVVPLSMVREGNFLYFHSASSGRKVDILKDEAKVCVSFVGETKIPKLYTREELDSLKEEERISKVVSRVFTTEFESALVVGRLRKIENRDEKVRGLYLICKKYTEDRLDYFEDAVKGDLDHVNVYSIEIESLIAKRKKYDSSGQEMKWGRRE